MLIAKKYAANYSHYLLYKKLNENFIYFLVYLAYGSSKTKKSGSDLGLPLTHPYDSRAFV